MRRSTTLASVAGQIEPGTLARRRRSRTVGASIAASCLVVIVVLLTLGANGSIAAEAAAVAIPFAFVGVCASVALTVRSAVIVRIGSVHGWEPSRCETREVGHVRSAHVEIVVRRLVRLRPWDGVSNSRKLLGAIEVELAGDLSGKVLLRLPGDAQIFIYRAA